MKMQYVSKRGALTCKCPAYPFPHRASDKRCQALQEMLQGVGDEVLEATGWQEVVDYANLLPYFDETDVASSIWHWCFDNLQENEAVVRY